MKAVQFVAIDNDNQFKVCAEGAKIFDSQIDPFAILIVTGLYRTGKSYLLNLLMEGNDLFKVDPGTQTCTRGIWAASNVLNEGREENKDR